MQKVLGNDWTRGVYGSNGGGWKLMNGDISIFYHPGGGKHGGSYYGILVLCQDLAQNKMRSSVS